MRRGFGYHGYLDQLTANFPAGIKRSMKIDIRQPSLELRQKH